MKKKSDVQKKRNRVLREVLDEIAQEKRKRTSFPHWNNWTNWGNWTDWSNWWT